MTWYRWEVLAVATVTAAACALPGTLLVLRRNALIADAVSHSVLPGIVLAYLVVKDLASPLLVAGATVFGLLAVWLIEALQRSGRLRQDAATGLVFPAFFALGVLLVALQAGHVHLDTDAVLLGELAFSALDRLQVAGQDLGPRAFFVMAGVLALQVVLIATFFHEVQASSFDAEFAKTLGLHPQVVHLGLMTLTALTVVTAFDAVGSVLVVALMIAPGATARLWSRSFPRMLILAVALATGGSALGFALAWWSDSSLAGSMAVAVGGLFLLSWVLAPREGLLSRLVARRARRRHFALRTLCVHLLQHQDSPEADMECREDHLLQHVAWDSPFAREVVRSALTRGLVRRLDGRLLLTDAGRTLALDTLGQ
ncbi:MAG TPA: metal ABC transporter permease [Myxococcota bacterium]|nr:metal ABC transporter permease [Myxococcota bacterium]HQK50595.1 metal ABC transporter permease [Myxococcota bacterium]